MNPEPTPTLSFVISAKNRPDSLARAIASIRLQNTPNREIVVVDDGSDPPLTAYGPDVMILRNETSRGMCGARNLGAQAARGKYLLFLDDDAEFVSPDEATRALEFSLADPGCSVVGFRQLRPDGTTHYMQPARGQENCWANKFFGYAFIFERARFLELGGFAEPYGYYDEETELSIRLIARGYRIAFAWDARVLHHEDPRGRDQLKIARLGFRNNVLTVLLTYPAWLVPLGVVRAVRNSVKSSRHLIGFDARGKLLALRQVLGLRRFIAQRRDPVRWKDLMEFRRLGRQNPRIGPAAVPSSFS